MTELKDEYGAVRFYLLPFSRPAVKKELYGEDMPDFEAGVLAALLHNPPEPSLRNVLVAHEFVTSKGADPVLSDSEVRVSVGGRRPGWMRAALRPMTIRLWGISTAVRESGRGIYGMPVLRLNILFQSADRISR